MAYTVLARRYRSRSFDEVIGQEAIAATLRNALETDRVGHAYLFCGTRGVGKTTMARLFAAEINLQEDVDQADDVRDAIMRGEDLDVIEIDGASNRGVQEARDLIANAGLSPSRSPYKIYIIDEVHMLTTESFNTLLKTMEEPPEHVKFILCTTEPNKVLHTIQSRCQRFDFKPIPSSLITSHLKDVLAQEGVEAEEEVISRVAEMGDGSMRDALSVLERLLASGPARLEAALVDEVLGLPDQAQIGIMFDAILDGDPAVALEQASALLGAGTSLDQIISCMIDRLRSLLLVTTCGRDTELLQVTESTRESLAVQAARLDAPGVLYLLSLCEHASRSLRLSVSARAVMDTTIVRMALAENLGDVQSLLGASPVAGAQKKTKADLKSGRSSGTSPRTSARGNKASPAPDVIPQKRQVPSPASEVASPDVEVKSSEPVLDLKALWDRVIEQATTPGAKAKVDAVEPSSLQDGVLLMRVKASVGGGFIRSQGGVLSEMVSAAAGYPVKVEFNDEPEVSAESKVARPVPAAAPSEAVAGDEVVQMAVELLDAVVMDVDQVNAKHGHEPEE